jgi:hypothetical protein
MWPGRQVREAKEIVPVLASSESAEADRVTLEV